MICVCVCISVVPMLCDLLRFVCEFVQCCMVLYVVCMIGYMNVYDLCMLVCMIVYDLCVLYECCAYFVRFATICA